ncbi:hypothetical protein BTUL_0046g00230 [Botrytis tulipae]|uniref:Uncharacterized protein n=1 Tax=Botrytis tulipae TaxID=87230 RepID=A0A4Z1ER96_9HELO|nr:hypothetical protein BTUL_0046g00230 [Botrytis tulipae]
MDLRHPSSQPVADANCTKHMLSSLFTLPSSLGVPPPTKFDEEQLAKLKEVIVPGPYRIWLMWRPQSGKFVKGETVFRRRTKRQHILKAVAGFCHNMS